MSSSSFYSGYANEQFTTADRQAALKKGVRQNVWQSGKRANATNDAQQKEHNDLLLWLIKNWNKRDDYVGIPSKESPATFFVPAGLLYAVLDLTREDVLHAVTQGLTIEKVCAMIETRFERYNQNIDYRDTQSLGTLNWAIPGAANRNDTPELDEVA